MMGFINDFFRRRKMRPIIADLPQKLKQQFGGSEFYSAGQVDTSAAQLKIKPGLMPAAHAVACTPDEFSQAEPDLSTSDYQAVRAEIARLFGLDEWHMNCRTLLSSSKPSQSIGSDPPPLQHD